MSEPRNGFFAGGNFITDYVKVIDAWPAQDTLATIRSQSMSNGGGPYNVLKDLSKLAPEIPLEACGLVGNDPNGAWILEDLESAGINVRQIHCSDEVATSYTDAMTVGSTGRRTFFHQRGANALLGPEHFDFRSTSAKVFLLGYLMLLDTLDSMGEDGRTGAARVLGEARKAGLVTAVDCVSEPDGKFRDIVLSALPEIDILFVNEYEIGQVLGREITPDCKSLLAAALELVEESSSRDIQVVLHAAEGAIVACGNGVCEMHPPVALPRSEIAGATGAGDAFAAGYLLGVHRGHGEKDCLRYAVCSAAQSLRDPTPSGGMSLLENCLELEKRHGYRDF